jgi:hypothetical protein
MVYSKSVGNNWIIFVPRTMNSTVRIHDPIDNGVYVEWASDGPTIVELAEIQTTLNIDVRDLSNFTKSSDSVFFPSPARLNVNTSKTNRIWFPKAHPRWLVAVIPFHRQEDDDSCFATLPPFQFPQDFTEANPLFNNTP